MTLGNAKFNIVAAMAAANGIIALIEGTSNSRQQLATVRFIEGLSKFEDERTLKNDIYNQK